ncbi:MAG TPA: bifunctional aspartate transaminase/aspartate 4-decarboxylase [Bryobacteraceae bacterium]|nr:bifunctional aspartate transaminase/aspartate 4-decarboxylase [Bryobacteraceae bacterium]
MPTNDSTRAENSLQQLSPFQLKDELIRYAQDQTRSKAATHKFLNAGRGNPNWIAATPRESFFLLGQFALSEARQTRDEGSLAGMPAATGVAGRMRAFLDAGVATPGAALLQRGIDYATSTLGFDADAFAHELVDAIIGDNYPEPDRMLVHAEKVVHRYLIKTMCDDRSPGGTFDLFAVEGGTAAMCYVFKSLFENRLLRQGDTIALGTPIFTPYIELPRLSDYGLNAIEINQSALTADGRHMWQYPDEEIAKLADPAVKAFFLVNPSNPASYAMHSHTQQRIVDLVKNKRPDLIILTDDVYGTFADGFRSLAADLPHNTILVYSYSKHFGCTGWRLGVIALHQDNVLDKALARLPVGDRAALHERYQSLSTTPERIKFIDRLVADSRDVALNHTAGLSTPQQAQMVLFSLFALLDKDDAYQARCRELVRQRLASLGRGMDIAIPDDPLRVGYYLDIDLAVWGRAAFGDEFNAYVDAHHNPLEAVIALAKRSGTVLLNGSGFDGPPWSVRISLANLNADAYEAIGRDLKELMSAAFEEWRRSRRSGS